MLRDSSYVAARVKKPAPISGIPAQVVTGAHLILEEASEQQTLCASRLHQVTVVGHRRVDDELVEDDAEVFRRGNLRFGVHGDLRVVRQHAGVVEQLLTIDSGIRDVLQTRHEELECAALVDG